MNEDYIELAELLTDRTYTIDDRIAELRPVLGEIRNLCYEAELIKKMIIELDLPVLRNESILELYHLYTNQLL